jgi:hypothetical protein
MEGGHGDVPTRVGRPQGSVDPLSAPLTPSFQVAPPIEPPKRLYAHIQGIFLQTDLLYYYKKRERPPLSHTPQGSTPLHSQDVVVE